MAMGNECFVILRNGSVGEVIMREVYSSKSNDIKLQRIPNFGGNHSIAIVTNGQKLSCRRKEIKHSKGRIAQPKQEAFTTHNPPLATKSLEIVHPTPSKCRPTKTPQSNTSPSRESGSPTWPSAPSLHPPTAPTPRSRWSRTSTSAAPSTTG